MEKRIRESAYGDYVVEFGRTINEMRNPVGAGYVMKSFLVYQSFRYDTIEEAEKAEYIYPKERRTHHDRI